MRDPGSEKRAQESRFFERTLSTSKRVVICSTIKFFSFLGTDFPFHVTLSFPLGFSSASFTPVIEGPPSDLKINTRDPRSNKDEYLYADRIFCAPFGLHLSVTTNGIRT